MVGIFGIGEKCVAVFFKNAHEGIGAGTPFFMNDSAFLVYLFRRQCQAVRPVVKDEQAGIYY